ncbi:hypothetical protein BD560DRAFT_388283 [Blakeslea trispora]|nr:hypothetical protein BD560DRAFT_388283 [Blakeslea trispora]
MTGSSCDEPIGKSWADMVEEDEMEEHSVENQDENSSKETTTSPNLVKIETGDETQLVASASGSRWAAISSNEKTDASTISNGTPVSRWAALDADRTYPRSSFINRNDYYRPTGGRLNRSAFEEDTRDYRNGGFSNRSNFNSVDRHRNYHELKREDETPEVKQAIAAWNNYQPNDDSDEESNEPKGPSNPSNYPYNVVLVTPQKPILETKRKDLPYDEKAARAATHTTNFSFSWADDVSDTSDNDEEDLIRLSGKASDQGQGNIPSSIAQEKVNTSPSQNALDSTEPIENKAVKEESIENASTDIEGQQPVAKEALHIEEQHRIERAESVVQQEEKPVYQWGVLDEYKEFEAKQSRSTDAIDKEQEAEAVSAWHSLKAPIEEEKEELEQQEENNNDWQKEANWTQNQGEASHWQPDTPEQSLPEPANSWNTSATTEWNQTNESATQSLGWDTTSTPDQPTKEKKSFEFKDTWRNKIQSTEDNSTRWKSFAETNDMPVVRTEDKAPAYTLPTSQPEISQPEPKPSILHEVGFSLSDFQGELEPKKTAKKDPQPTISLDWKEFANQEEESEASSLSVSINKEAKLHQANVSLFEPSQPIMLRLSDICEKEPSQDIQLKSSEKDPIQHVQLKLSDFNVQEKPKEKEYIPPKEERNSWGNVRQDAHVIPQSIDVPQGTSQPRRRIQMGGAHWAHLQKSLLSNKK